MDIQTTLLTSLRKLSKQQTADTLGNCGSYLGASDVGHCPRKVILEKINPAEHNLASLLRFQRGHMAEDIIAMAFTAAGYTNFERQVEIELHCEGVPFQAHIDFVFTSKVSKVKSILEVKSSNVPDSPYGSWESQLYVQMGGKQEDCPDYTIKGAILAIDLAAGEVGLFSGYSPNSMMFQGLKDRAASIWSDYQATLNGEEVSLSTEPGPLCSFCHHLMSCPRFEAQEAPDMAEFVQELEQLQLEEKALKNKIKPFKINLQGIVEQIGPIKVNNHILKMKSQERKSLDTERLELFLSDHGHSLSDFQNPYKISFLDITRSKAA
jgi:CRISPR-associated exonuclease Cas4